MDYFRLIESTLSYIEEHLIEEIKLDDLAESVYTSKFHFHRIFKALTGYSVTEYIDRRRLSLVCHKLKDSNQTILKIALACGFNSHEVLTRKFKKYFGLSPKQYRNHNETLANFERISLLERRFLNKSNQLVVEFTVQSFGVRVIAGKKRNNCYADTDERSVYKFLFPFADTCFQNNPEGYLYLAVLYHEKSIDEIDYFIGFDHDKSLNSYESLLLEEGSYAVFKYKGVFRENIKAITEEIYRSIAMSTLTLKDTGIELIEVYDCDYPNTMNFEIHVPLC